MVVSWPYCDRLNAIVNDTWREQPTISGIGLAVLLFTHEAGHLRGWAWADNERVTNCWAVRHVRYTALHLGASDDLARNLSAWASYWYRHQPVNYRLPGCKTPY